MSFAVMAVWLIGCGASPKHATWKTATGAGAYEQLMWQSIQKKDWKEFEYHLSPTFAGTTASGRVLDRAGWLEYWRAAPVREASVGEIEVRPAGADMVITLVLHLSGPNPASSSAANQGYRVTSVWQQLKGGWTLTATSLTPILPD